MLVAARVTGAAPEAAADVPVFGVRDGVHNDDAAALDPLQDDCGAAVAESVAGEGRPMPMRIAVVVVMRPCCSTPPRES